MVDIRAFVPQFFQLVCVFAVFYNTLLGKKKYEMVLSQKPFPNVNGGGVAILQMRKQASYKHWGSVLRPSNF